MVDVVASGDPSDDKVDDEDDHRESLLAVGSATWLVIVVPPAVGMFHFRYQ